MSTLQDQHSADVEVAATIAPAASEAAEADEANADLRTAGVEQLIIGSQLKYPIYDPKGVLLLAEESTITSEFTELLKKWNLQTVQLHADDIGNLTLAVREEDAVTVAPDEELSRRLDKNVSAGLVFSANSGPAAREQIVQHGTEGYDPDTHERILNHHQQCSKILGRLMAETKLGLVVDAEQVSQIARQYVAEMSADIGSVLATVHDRTPEQGLANHCLKMALLGMAMGIEMELDEDHVRRIGVTGLVHDWGMLRVPEEIRNASRRLRPSEFLEIKKHPIYSVEMLERCRHVPAQVPLASYQVHERPNGSGYPRNRSGDGIHLYVRILCVADAYCALVSARPFRKPLKPYAAIECLVRQSYNGDVDAECVRALLRVVSLFPIGSFVVLTDGSVACVLRANGSNYTEPIVRLVQDADGNPIPQSDDSAILDLTGSELAIAQALATPGRDEIGLSNDVLDGVESVCKNEEESQTTAPTATAETSTHAHPSLDRYSEHQARALQRALHVADRCAARTEWQFMDSRKHRRSKYHSAISVHVPDGDDQLAGPPPQTSFRALAREMSQGGLSFLHPEQISDDFLVIGIEMPDGTTRWIESKIVRRGEISTEGFWEYGVAFRRCVNA